MIMFKYINNGNIPGNEKIVVISLCKTTVSYGID